MRLTDHFSLAEFAQPARHGFQSEPYPREWVNDRLLPLCAALELIRDALRSPITVLSGYRSEAYNRCPAVRGARNSQHVQGRAADIRVPGIAPEAVHEVALVLHEHGTIRLGGLGLYPSWCHVDIRPGKRLARWTGSRSGS